MRKAPTIRFAVTLVVVGGAVILSAAVAVVALTRASGDAGLGPLGWLLPLATIVVVCGIALILVDEGPDSVQSKPADPDLRDCPACGQKVNGEWRLCPWCGDRLAIRDKDRAA